MPKCIIAILHDCEGDDQGEGITKIVGDKKIYENVVGDKRYELSNHLGNVLSVITDRKLVGGSAIAAATPTHSFTYASNADGWVGYNATLGPVAVGHDNGRLKVTAGITNVGTAKVVQLQAGKKYQVSFDLDKTETTMEIRSSVSSGQVGAVGSTSALPNGRITYSLDIPTTAPATTGYTINVRVGGVHPGGEQVFHIDNVTVTEMTDPATEGLQPDVVAYYDYDPFGMLVNDRYFEPAEGNYRYGFNGMEKDDELKGKGNSYNTEFRQYDPRIGRWLSLDPLMATYPHQSPYAAFNNNPIYFADPTGLEGDPPGGDGDGSERPRPGEEPCGTCNRRETTLQRAVRNALVTTSQAYNIQHFFQTDNEEEDSDVTAPQLFYQWVMGTGKDKRTFNEKSVMGEQILKASEVEDAIDKAVENFKENKDKTTRFRRSLSEENEFLYMGSFVKDYYKNPARAFHGSYSGKITVTKTEQTTLGTYYYLNIQITDKMSATSGTRLPPVMGGYEDGGAIFNGSNPYGPRGHFRTIKIKYDMNIKIFKFNSLTENAKKFYNYITE